LKLILKTSFFSILETVDLFPGKVDVLLLGHTCRLKPHRHFFWRVKFSQHSAETFSIIWTNFHAQICCQISSI